MERVEVEAYSQDVNAWVIRTPGRRFPSLVVQGDAFRNLVHLAGGLVEGLRQSGCDAELIDEAEEVYELLRNCLNHYEATCREAGF